MKECITAHSLLLSLNYVYNWQFLRNSERDIWAPMNPNTQFFIESNLQTGLSSCLWKPELSLSQAASNRMEPYYYDLEDMTQHRLSYPYTIRKIRRCHWYTNVTRS